MREAVRVRVRYELPNADGQTRRERNEAFGKGYLTPDVEVPEEGAGLWEMFWNVIETEGRVSQGEAFPLSHVALKAWAENTGQELDQWEFAVLADMSAEWARAINEELEARRKADQNG